MGASIYIVMRAWAVILEEEEDWTVTWAVSKRMWIKSLARQLRYTLLPLLCLIWWRSMAEFTGLSDRRPETNGCLGGLMPGDSARVRASDQSGNSGSIYLPCRRRIGDRTRGVRVDRRGGICTRPRAMPKQRAPVAGSDSIGKSTARPEDSGLRPAAGPPSPSPARARSTVRGQRRRRRRRMEMRDIDPPDLGARPRAICKAVWTRPAAGARGGATCVSWSRLP
jgi:hypothetical protein